MTHFSKLEMTHPHVVKLAPGNTSGMPSKCDDGDGDTAEGLRHWRQEPAGFSQREDARYGEAIRVGTSD